MRLLALDTSTESCSVALLTGGELRLRCQMTERSHAELVLPMVQALLEEAALELKELDGIAFGRGPGAFTGLRIAAGVAQGLAFGAGLAVAPVSSLAAVAEQVPAQPGECVLACNDARMGEVYWGAYRREADGSMNALATERVTAPALVTDAATGIVHVAGNALGRFPALREQLAAMGLRIHDGIYPRADAVARLGELEFLAGRTVSAEQALPVYVRDDVARPPRPPVTGVS
jgi:tRNA threonylcarbamoyladenosine biosynthesis protein TsaB